MEYQVGLFQNRLGGGIEYFLDRLLIVDGLVQRDIRKFQAARESTFLFRKRSDNHSLFLIQ